MWYSNYTAVCFIIITLPRVYNHMQYIQVTLEKKKQVIHAAFIQLRTDYSFISDLKFPRRHFEIIKNET